MITFSLSKDGIAVEGEQVKLVVFPSAAISGTWSLLSGPREELEEKVISWPGEYDFDGVSIRAIGQEEGKRVSYTCAIEGVRCAFIDAPISAWTEKELEGFGEIDVLCIKADNSKNVVPLLEEVDPRLLLIAPSEEEKGIAALVKACGGAAGEPVAEYKVKSGALPEGTRQVVVLR